MPQNNFVHTGWKAPRIGSSSAWGFPIDKEKVVDLKKIYDSHNNEIPKELPITIFLGEEPFKPEKPSSEIHRYFGKLFGSIEIPLYINRFVI